MKFVKIRLKNVPGTLANTNKTVEEWRCVISNLSDLHAYANFEGHLISRAFLQLERTFDGSRFDGAHAGDKRTGALATLLNIRAERLEVGETFNPLIETANIHAAKVASMSRMLGRGEAICINTAGGFCGLESFLEQWKAEIIETVEKDDQGFPIDAEAMNAATLILENQDHVNTKLRDIVSKRTESKPAVILQLKEKDQRWIYKSMLNAKTLAFVSTFSDQEQVEEFLDIFDKMPRKEIIIGYYGDEIEKLTLNPRYEKVGQKHSIELINLYNIK